MRYHKKSDGSLVPFSAEEEAAWTEREQAAIANMPEARKAKLEADYHAMVAGSLCNLQSQTAWLGAIALQQPCNQVKILECRDWLDRLWAQYHADKAAGLEAPSFTEPAPAYSFLETMAP